METKRQPETCGSLCATRGVDAIFACWCLCCKRTSDIYTDDAYTLVRNHPLFIAGAQTQCSGLIEHPYHTYLRRSKLNSFGLWIYFFSFFCYLAYLGLFVSYIVMGKHPQYFYEKANQTFNIDLTTCKNVGNLLSAPSNITAEIFKTDKEKRIQKGLYIVSIIMTVKNLIMISALFPRVFRVGAYYVEISAMVLTYTYILDWFDWQIDLKLRCPVQYQLGAMGLLISFVNLLVYIRSIPFSEVGIYIVMFQVISVKFLHFLPVLMIIVCGFGLTYWMLLQNEAVYGTPIEAIIRTSLMLFDLGYESRLYGNDNDSKGHYALVYLIFLLTAITFSIFVVNLLIGQ